MFVYIRQLCAWMLELTSGVFLCHSPPYVLSQGFSLNLELADSAILASQLVPGVPSLPGRAVRHHTCPALLGILDLNSDPHTCIANSPGPLCTVLSNRDVLFQGTRHIIKAGGKRQPCLIALQPLRGALFSGVTVSSLSSPPSHLLKPQQSGASLLAQTRAAQPPASCLISRLLWGFQGPEAGARFRTADICQILMLAGIPGKAAGHHKTRYWVRTDCL